MKTYNLKSTIILIFIFAFTGFQSFSQQQKLSLIKENYLLKSKHQKTAAWILLSAGFATTVTGLVIGLNDGTKYIEDFFTLTPDNGKTDGTAIVIAGVAAMAGSIPFFISSKKNNNRAFSISLQNLRTPQFDNQSLVYHNTLSLKFTMHL